MISKRFSHIYDEFFPVMTGIIEMPEFYIVREKEIIRQEHDEELAIKLGFEPDKYYTAKEKMDEEDNKQRRKSEGSNGSFGSGFGFTA